MKTLRTNLPRLHLVVAEGLGFPVAICAAYLACIYTFAPGFFSFTNLSSILYYCCLLAPAVLGVQLLIVLGLFDLSVGSVAAASGVAVATVLSAGGGVPLALCVGAATGLLFGVINWLLVTKANLPALIATLVTMAGARALATGLTKGQYVTIELQGFDRISHGTVAGMPGVVLLGVGLVVVLEFLTRRHVVFRRLYHVGSSRTAAADNGINVPRLECLAFVLSGLSAAAVGVFQCSRTLSASPQAFPDLALECIAACVIGGTNIMGGSGRPFGAFLGMAMVVVSRNLVYFSGVSVYWKDLAVALVLLAAALLNRPRMKV